MDSVFRPSSGLVLALYVDGIRCSFEQLSYSYGAKQPPMVMGRVGATHGTKKVEEYPTEIQVKIEHLTEERSKHYAELSTAELAKAKAVGPVAMEVTSTTLNLIKQNYPLQSTPAPNLFPDPRGLAETKIVGYNHEILAGKAVKTPATDPIATPLLLADLKPIKTLLYSSIKVELAQGQTDALYSLMLDIGTQAFKNSALLILINKSEFEGAAKVIETFKLHRGVAEPILIARRLSEANMFRASITTTILAPVSALTEGDQFDLALKKRGLLKKEDTSGRTAKVQARIAEIEKELATLKATVKEETTKATSWRNVRPNTKIHVLFKDNNWGPNPRFVGYFEGELTSPGFHSSAESRDFQFQSLHITECLDSLVIAALEPDSFIKDKIEATSIQDGIPAELVSSGTVIQDFSPKALAEFSGVAEEDMDVYNMAKFALSKFLKMIGESNVKNNYYARAAKFHEIQSRIYDPNYDPETFTVNGSKTKLKWSRFYYFIMTYVFTNLIPRLGNRISYMQMINTIMELFLHEVMINPAPADSHSTVLIKPVNVFTPIPVCNIIFPIHGGEFNHMESYRSKPTRLIQTAQPPNGLPGDGALRRYYTNIAPMNLSTAYTKYFELTDPVEKAKVELITEEERKRGIIASYNDLPSLLTALLQLITITDSTGDVYSDVRKVLGAGAGFADSAAVPASVRKSHGILYFHKQLMLLEDPDKYKKFEDLSNDKLSDLKPAFTSAHKYIPKRITIIPFDLIPAKTSKVNYTIIAGKVTRKLGRSFHVFQEPTDSVPMLFKINTEREVITKEDKQQAFLIGDKTSEEAQLDPTYKKVNDDVKHLKDMQSFVAGGYHQSLVISVDNDTNSYAKLAQLLAIICEMCNITMDTKENTGNIRTMSDYWGEDLGHTTYARDQVIKKVIVTAQDIRKTMVTASEAIIGPLVAAATPAGTGGVSTSSAAGGYNKMLVEGLHANEGGSATPWKISHAIKGASNYTFGKSQFDIGQNKAPWLKAGLSEAEAALLIATGKRVNAAQSQKVETAAEKTFIAGLEERFKLNTAVIAQLDSGQSVALIANAERQLKTLFGRVDVKFDNPSILAHLVDIANQFGSYGIDNGIHGADSIAIMTKGSDSKTINAAGVLAWRVKTDYGSGASGNADMRRRHDNIERIYAGQGGKSLTVDQVIAAAHSGDTISLASGSTGSGASGVGGMGNSATSVAVPGAVEDGINNTENIDPSGVNIKHVFKYYSQPLCEYYFYYNRYINNKDSVNIVFNPYAIAGYSTLIMDNSELQVNLFAHIDTITHTANANGTIGTTLGIGFIRRADDLGMPEDLRLTAGNADVLRESTGSADGATGPASVAESLKDSVPFFGGEYAEDQIDETYQKTIGCERLVNGEVLFEHLNSNDIVSIYEATRRRMQYCKVTNVGDSALQTEYDKLYKENPSRIAFKWNNGDFPDRISIIKKPEAVVAIQDYASLFRPGEDGYELISDDKLFDPDTQELVRRHTAITMASRAQRG